MFGRAYKQDADQEAVERQDVDGLVIVSHEGKWEDDWYNVRKDVFHRRGVETRKRNRGSEAVVELVVASVEPREVEDTMDVIAQHLARNVTPNEVSHHLLERGQSGGDDEDGPEIGQIAESNLKSDVPKGDEGGVADAMDNLGAGGLSMWLGLMFVCLGELWETNVGELVDRCR